VSWATAAAIWAISNGDRLLVSRPNRSCASTSSCGSSGTEVNVTSGAVGSPRMKTVMVFCPEVDCACRSSCGTSVPGAKVMVPRWKFNRRVRRLSVPRRSERPPRGAGAATVPPTVTSPPSSTSTPRPRMNTARGATIRTARFRGGPAAAAGVAAACRGPGRGPRGRRSPVRRPPHLADVGERRDARRQTVRDADFGVLDPHLAGQGAPAGDRARQAQVRPERGGDEVGRDGPGVARGDRDVGRQAGGADVQAAGYRDRAVAGRATFETLDHQAGAVPDDAAGEVADSDAVEAVAVLAVRKGCAAGQHRGADRAFGAERDGEAAGEAVGACGEEGRGERREVEVPVQARFERRCRPEAAGQPRRRHQPPSGARVEFHAQLGGLAREPSFAPQRRDREAPAPIGSEPQSIGLHRPANVGLTDRTRDADLGRSRPFRP
jgi:hypothetical protein